VITPYKDSSKGKKAQVELMFDNIAGKYDFLNHFLSLGIDKIWRRKAISYLVYEHPENILDIATGTGDLAITALRAKPKQVTGLDLSAGMLEMGRKKILEKSLDHIISLEKGDSENLRFENESFQAITCAFGVRNFENLDKGLQEMYRVLSPGGTMVILEFSKPSTFPVKQVYNFYFKNILPFWGRLFSKDQSAYTYLPESVNAFPEGKDFLTRLQKAGFSEMKQRRLSMGVASIYVAKK